VLQNEEGNSENNPNLVNIHIDNCHKLMEQTIKPPVEAGDNFTVLRAPPGGAANVVLG